MINEYEINPNEHYSFWKQPKIDQIKQAHKALLESAYNDTLYELALRDWHLIAESPEHLTLKEALDKFKVI